MRSGVCRIWPPNLLVFLSPPLAAGSSCLASCPPQLLAPLLSHDINLSQWYLLFDVTRKTHQTFYSWSMSNAELDLEFKCPSPFPWLLSYTLHTKPDEQEISGIKRDHRSVHTYLHHDPTIKIINIPREHWHCCACKQQNSKHLWVMWVKSVNRNEISSYWDRNRGSGFLTINETLFR